MAEGKPLLVGLFWGLGFLCLVAAGFFLLAGIINVLGEATDRLFTCIVGFFSCLLCGLLYFGLAQVISLIAAIADSTESASTTLQRYLTPSTQGVSKSASGTLVPIPRVATPPKAAAKRNLLDWIDRVPIPRADTPLKAAPKMYYCYVDNRETGPHSPQDMIDLHEAGVIDASTSVRKEGESDWDAFSSHPEMRWLFAQGQSKDRPK